MNKKQILNTRLEDEQLALFYLGQEGFLLKFRETYLLIDPYLTDYVDRNCSDVTICWKRNYPSPIAPEELDFIDYVLCTHAHFDHADPDSLRTLAKVNPKAMFLAPAPIKDTILSYGIAPKQFLGALADEEILFNNFRVVPVPSAHEELHTDASRHYTELGYRIFAENISLYHAGDCCIYEGLAERLMDTDIAMLPVNGRSYYKRYEQDIIGNMTAEEAVILAKEIRSDLLVPMHYDLYDVNGINPAQFVDTLFTLAPRQKFHLFVPGECYIYAKQA